MTQNIYDDFFKDLIAFIDYKPSQVLSYDEINVIAAQIDRRIPQSIAALLHHIGLNFSFFSADWLEYDLITCMEVMNRLGEEFDFIKLVSPAILPIMNRYGQHIWFVYPDKDDPDVFSIGDFSDSEEPERVSDGYTIMIRSQVLRLVEWNYQNEEILKHDYQITRNPHLANRLVPAQNLAKETIKNINILYRDFLKRIHNEDILRGKYTLTAEVQERWLSELRGTEYWRILAELKRRVPFAWTSVEAAEQGMIAKL